MPRPQFFPRGAEHQTQILAGAGRASASESQPQSPLCSHRALIPGFLVEEGIKMSSHWLLVEAFCICWPWSALLSAILELGKLKQEDCKLKASLGFMADLSQTNKMALLMTAPLKVTRSREVLEKGFLCRTSGPSLNMNLGSCLQYLWYLFQA